MNNKLLIKTLNFIIQVFWCWVFLNDVKDCYDKVSANPHKLLKIVGYVALIDLQEPHEQNKTLQVKIPQSAGDNDSKANLSDIKTKMVYEKKTCVSKGVEILTETTFETWYFSLMINIRTGYKNVARLLYDNPEKQKMDDKAKNTPVDADKKAQYDAFVVDFQKETDYEDQITHVHSGILKTLSTHDKQTVMSVPFPDPGEPVFGT